MALVEEAQQIADMTGCRTVAGITRGLSPAHAAPV